jgi:tetratricopeptide (TPR) repeat protein
LTLIRPLFKLARGSRSLPLICTLLLGTAATAQSKPAATTSPAPSSTLTASPMEDLPARMQAATAAQQTGDVVKIATANRNLLAVGLRALAELKLAQGDTKQAIDLYQRALAFEDTPQTHIALALAYMRAQRIDDALAQIEPILKADPQNADAWNVQGKLLMDKKSYAPAAEALGRSLQLQGNPMVAYALATAFLNLKENAKAEAIFKQIAETAGDSASAHIMIGRAYQNADQVDAASREFNRAAQLDAKGSRAHYFLGLLYLSQNEWVATPAAREQFTEEIKTNPNDFFGNFFLGYIDNQDKQYDDSDRYLKTAARDKPDWPEPYLYMGLNAFARHDDKNAEELLRKAIQLTGDDTARNNYQIRRAYYVLGRICYQTDRKDEAAKYTKIFSDMQAKTEEISRVASPASKTQGTMGSGMAAMPSVPTSAMIDPAAEAGESAPQLTAQQKADVAQAVERLSVIVGSAYNDLGTAEARQKQYSEALANFQQAERWEPALPHLMRNIGFAAFRAGQHAEAARALKIAAQQDPGDKMIPPMLAMSQFSADQYAEAAKSFDQMGDAAYGDPRAAYAYAVSLARSNQPDKAKAVVARMAQRDLPPDGLLLLGEAYSEVGEPQQALTTIQKALQANPSLPRAHYFAGMAQLKLKQPLAAIAEFEAELKLNPSDVETQFQLGKALLEQGKAKEALPHLEASAKLNPDIAAVHEQLSLAYRKAGRIADADREAKLAASQSKPKTPSNP